jgi:hypothetical protein
MEGSSADPGGALGPEYDAMDMRDNLVGFKEIGEVMLV